MLRRWAYVPQYLADKRGEIERMEAEIDDCAALKGAASDGMPHGGAPGRPTERNALIRFELEELYKKRIGELRDDIEEELTFARQMDYLVEKLTVEQMKVIKLRFKNAYSYIKIADIMSYDERSIRRIEGEALDYIHSMIL